MKAKQLVAEGSRRIRAGIDNLSWNDRTREQALDLLTAALGREPDLDEEIDERVRRRFDEMVARRARGEPIPYIKGWTEFRGLRLRVAREAFVPRATTEFLAHQAIVRLRRRPAPVHVDLATGIGPVALSSAAAVPHARVVGTDLSPDAVRAARANARRLGLRNVTFAAGDLFAPLPRRLRGGVDVLTIHPPYVARQEVKTLPAELRRFEPTLSLTDGSIDGMLLVRRSADEGRDWLRPTGWLLIEISPSLARQVASVLRRAGYRDVDVTTGEMPLTRVVVGRRA